MKPRGPAFCQQCGLQIGFRKRPDNGKLEPCNPDGSDHWDKCREERAAQARRGGQLVRTEGENGAYSEAWRNGRTKPFVVTRHAGRSRNHGKVSVCSQACAIPPWEPCECPEGLGVFQ